MKRLICRLRGHNLHHDYTYEQTICHRCHRVWPWTPKWYTA